MRRRTLRLFCRHPLPNLHSHLRPIASTSFSSTPVIGGIRLRCLSVSFLLIRGLSFSGLDQRIVRGWRGGGSVLRSGDFGGPRILSGSRLTRLQKRLVERAGASLLVRKSTA